MIYKALVMIHSDQLEPIRRRAIVRQIVKAMGLENKSWWYPDKPFP